MIDGFNEEFKKKDVKTINRFCSNIEHSLKKYHSDTPIAEMGTMDVLDLIYDSEKMALTLRACLETIERNRGTYYDNKIPMSLSNIPCTFSFDGSIVKIKTPLTIVKSKSSEKNRKVNYQIINYVNASILKWQMENPKENIYLLEDFTKGNLICVITRYALEYKRIVHCDHDNLENGRVINSLCLALGISDSCNTMDLYSRFRICNHPEDEGTEFIITRLKNLNRIL